MTSVQYTFVYSWFKYVQLISLNLTSHSNNGLVTLSPVQSEGLCLHLNV